MDRRNKGMEHVGRYILNILNIIVKDFRAHNNNNIYTENSESNIYIHTYTQSLILKPPIISLCIIHLIPKTGPAPCNYNSVLAQNPVLSFCLSQIQQETHI